MSSLFNTRWLCLNLVKNNNKDFIIYAGVVNRESEKLKLNKLTLDLFKCVLFVQGLISNNEAEIRSRIFAKLEMDPKFILHKIAE